VGGYDIDVFEEDTDTLLTLLKSNNVDAAIFSENTEVATTNFEECAAAVLLEREDGTEDKTATTLRVNIELDNHNVNLNSKETTLCPDVSDHRTEQLKAVDEVGGYDIDVFEEDNDTLLTVLKSSNVDAVIFNGEIGEYAGKNGDQKGDSGGSVATEGSCIVVKSGIAGNASEGWSTDGLFDKGICKGEFPHASTILEGKLCGEPSLKVSSAIADQPMSSNRNRVRPDLHCEG
jgi:hypothetical protein